MDYPVKVIRGIVIKENVEHVMSNARICGSALLSMRMISATQGLIYVVINMVTAKNIQKLRTRLAHHRMFSVVSYGAMVTAELKQ